MTVQAKKLSWAQLKEASMLSEKQFESDNKDFCRYLDKICDNILRNGHTGFSNSDLDERIMESFTSGACRVLGLLALIKLHRISGISIPTIVEQLKELRYNKGMDYQNSFRLIGYDGIWVMIATKLIRLASLEKQNAAPNFESVIDSWKDLVNYCGLMFICVEGQKLPGTAFGYIGPKDVRFVDECPRCGETGKHTHGVGRWDFFNCPLCKTRWQERA